MEETMPKKSNFQTLNHVLHMGSPVMNGQQTPGFQ